MTPLYNASKMVRQKLYFPCSLASESEHDEFQRLANKAQDDVQRFRKYFRRKFKFSPELIEEFEVPEIGKSKFIVLEGPE